MSRMTARHIRIGAEHWRRTESLANERQTTPNQLSVEFAIKALNPPGMAAESLRNSDAPVVPVHRPSYCTRHDCDRTQ